MTRFFRYNNLSCHFWGIPSIQADDVLVRASEGLYTKSIFKLGADIPTTFVAVSSKEFLILSTFLGKATIWTVHSETNPNGKRLHEISSSINTGAFSPDGKLLLVANQDNSIALWDIVSGRQRWKQDNFGAVHEIVFAPDGKTAALGVEMEQSAFDIVILNLTTQEVLKTLHGHKNYIGQLSFSADGKTLASASRDGTVRVWDVSKGKVLEAFDHLCFVDTTALSPDGKKLLTGCRTLGRDIGSDNSVCLWDVATGQVIYTLSAHVTPITRVAFSDDGMLMASASYDGVIRLWDVKSGSVVNTLTGHRDVISDIQLLSSSTDDVVLASLSLDRTMRRWRKQTTTGTTTPLSLAPNFKPKRVSADASVVLAQDTLDSSKPTLQIVSLTNGQAIRQFAEHDRDLTQAAFSPDGKLVLTSQLGENGVTILWETNTGKARWRVNSHPYSMTAAQFSPDGKQVLTGGVGGTVRLWQVSTGTQKQSFATSQANNILAVAFSPDGKMIATGGGDNKLRLYDLSAGKLIHDLSGHTSNIVAVTFSPDGKTIATAGSKVDQFTRDIADNTIRLWDVQCGKPIRTLTGHTDIISSLAFSPDGQTLLSASTDRSVRVWNIGTGQALRVYNDNTTAVMQAIFSPDGTTIISGSVEGEVRRWKEELDVTIASVCKQIFLDFYKGTNLDGTDLDERQIYGVNNTTKTCP